MVHWPRGSARTRVEDFSIFAVWCKLVPHAQDHCAFSTLNGEFMTVILKRHLIGGMNQGMQMYE